MQKIIKINGMMCEHCAAAVTAALEGIGATDLKIDLAGKTADFNCPDTVADGDIIKAIDEIGFEAQF